MYKDKTEKGGEGVRERIEKKRKSNRNEKVTDKKKKVKSGNEVTKL